MALSDKLIQVDKLKLELDALLPMSIENERRLWKKIRLDWNYNSNHIEGNTLTYGETELLLIFDKTVGDHELREYEEMKAHDVAIHIVKEWAKDKSRDLTESDIRELNKIILVQPYWKEAITPDGQPTRKQIKVGDYKEQPNSVRLKTGEIFAYTSPLETPVKMAELIQWYRTNDIKHPLVFASQLHYDFIRIHPFDDGNGRVARLMVNYVLMKNDFPPIIVKSEEKEKYLTALNKADVGDIDAFHEYMADQLIWSLETAIKAAKDEDIEEQGDLDKKLKMLKMEIADVDVDNEVQLQFNQNVFLNIYDSWLSELMRGLIVRIKKFDDLFAKPSHFLMIQNGMHEGRGGQTTSVQFEGKNENEIISALREELIKKAGFVHSDVSVTIHASYGTFKKGALIHAFGCNYDVEVFFDYLKYEVYRRKFVAGLRTYPNIQENLKDVLRKHPEVKMVYFDTNGNPHFEVFKQEGKLYAKVNEEEKPQIMLNYSSEEILTEKITHGGMERFAEPRLLHKPFTHSEIETLCTEFGNTIFSHIEYFTKMIILKK